ncbi:MAG: hypothetical protein WC791_04780 [Candidatus Paceibacterota bacterium]|jgi:hypothetical protein
MKSTIAVLLLMFCFLSQSALAADENSKLYFGIGSMMLTDKTFGVTSEEAVSITNYGGNRSNPTSSVGKEIFLAYQPSAAIAFEFGYVWDASISAETSGGTAQAASVRHTEEYSALKMSIVGIGEFSERINILAKGGIEQTRITSEIKTTYQSLSGNPPSHCESSTALSARINYGLGVEAKVLDPGNIWVRVMVEGVDGLPYSLHVGAIVRF